MYKGNIYITDIEIILCISNTKNIHNDYECYSYDLIRKTFSFINSFDEGLIDLAKLIKTNVNKRSFKTEVRKILENEIFK